MKKMEKELLLNIERAKEEMAAEIEIKMER